MKTKIFLLIFLLGNFTALAQEELLLKRTGDTFLRYSEVFKYKTILNKGLQQVSHKSNFKDKNFLILNQTFLNAILEKVHSTQFNRCRADNIVVNLDIDSTGKFSNVALSKGTRNAMIDSVIVQNIYSTNESAHSAVVEGKPINVSASIEILYVNMTRYFFYFKMLPIVDCTNNVFFYEEGLKRFKEENFQFAADDFKKSIEYNSADEDSYFNLAICYFKMNENEKACDCLKKGIGLYDMSAIKLYNKKCVGK